MRVAKWLSTGLLLAAVLASAGCARTARDTQGFAVADMAVVDAPFQEAWQSAKAVLRERHYDIYTRDKRGVFVEQRIGNVPRNEADAVEFVARSLRVVVRHRDASHPTHAHRESHGRRRRRADLGAVTARTHARL